MTVTVNRPTALGLSVLLHTGFLSLGILAALFAVHRDAIVITPVTLVGADQLVDPGYAEKAEEITEAQTEEPVAILEPTPVGEVPEPAPRSPPAPKAAPTPRAPPQPAPSSRPAAAPRPTPAFDARALEDQLAAASRQGGRSESGGRRGASQNQQALEALLSEGQARAATTNALNAIAAKIMRNWRINCADVGERNARVTLRLELDRRGGLVRSEVVGFRDVESIRDPALQSAATLALSAARAAAPFDGLPEQTFSDWRSKTYEFQGDVACQGR